MSTSVEAWRAYFVFNDAVFRDNTPWSFCPVHFFSSLCSFLPRDRWGYSVHLRFSGCGSVASQLVSSRLFSCLSLSCSERMSSHPGESLLCYAQWLFRVLRAPHSVCECSVTIQKESTLHLASRLRGGMQIFVMRPDLFLDVCCGPLDARSSFSSTREFFVVPWLRLRLQLVLVSFRGLKGLVHCTSLFSAWNSHRTAGHTVNAS